MLQADIATHIATKPVPGVYTAIRILMEDTVLPLAVMIMVCVVYQVTRPFSLYLLVFVAAPAAARRAKENMMLNAKVQMGLLYVQRFVLPMPLVQAVASLPKPEIINAAGALFLHAVVLPAAG
jgi:hypothetical protein